MLFLACFALLTIVYGATVTDSGGNSWVVLDGNAIDTAGISNFPSGCGTQIIDYVNYADNSARLGIGFIDCNGNNEPNEVAIFPRNDPDPNYAGYTVKSNQYYGAGDWVSVCSNACLRWSAANPSSKCYGFLKYFHKGLPGGGIYECYLWGCKVGEAPNGEIKTFNLTGYAAKPDHRLGWLKSADTCYPPTPAPVSTPAPVQTPAPTPPPVPGQTPQPTNPPVPGQTPQPTNPPVPGQTPQPTNPPVATPTTPTTTTTTTSSDNTGIIIGGAAGGLALVGILYKQFAGGGGGGFGGGGFSGGGDTGGF